MRRSVVDELGDGVRDTHPLVNESPRLVLPNPSSILIRIVPAKENPVPFIDNVHRTDLVSHLHLRAYLFNAFRVWRVTCE
jgi:hypothetical protein